MKPLIALKSLFTDLLDYSDAERWVDIKRRYQLPPSLSKHLSWDLYDHKHQAFLLSDGKTVGSAYEVTALSTEACSDERLEILCQHLQSFIPSVFPAYYDKESPWVVQIYVNDEPDLTTIADKFDSYCQSTHAYTQFYKKLFRDHYRFVCQEKGVFDDPMTGLRYRGRLRRVRMCFYRPQVKGIRLRHGQTPLLELMEINQAFEK